MRNNIVTLEEARKLQQQGKMIKNKSYDQQSTEQINRSQTIFKADYMIHWRPNELLPEKDQFAKIIAV